MVDFGFQSSVYAYMARGGSEGKVEARRQEGAEPPRPPF